MSTILRFANLPDGEIGDAELAQLLDDAGLTDRSDARIVDEGGVRALHVTLPWERHIADAVAKKLDGRMWRGSKLTVRASHMFGG
jgi:hypothetical protein